MVKDPCSLKSLSELLGPLSEGDEFMILLDLVYIDELIHFPKHLVQEQFMSFLQCIGFRQS